MSAGNNAWGPLRFDLLSTDMYTNVTPNVMQELGELSKNLSFQGRFRASGGWPFHGGARPRAADSSMMPVHVQR